MKIISRAEGEGAVDVFTKQWIHFKKKHCKIKLASLSFKITGKDFQKQTI